MPAFSGKISLMKKLLIAALFLFGCNSSEDMDAVKKEISNKIPGYLIKETKGRLLVNETTLYHIEKITEKDALDFRISALKDSVIIQGNLIGLYKSAVEAKQKDMAALDSQGISLTEIKKLISRYNHLADSTSLAAVNTKKLLDSLSVVRSVDDNEKNFYNTSFSVCSFNISTSTTCDSVAFLIDKKLNIISMHIIH